MKFLDLPTLLKWGTNYRYCNFKRFNFPPYNPSKQSNFEIALNNVATYHKEGNCNQKLNILNSKKVKEVQSIFHSSYINDGLPFLFEGSDFYYLYAKCFVLLRPLKWGVTQRARHLKKLIKIQAPSSGIIKF